MSVASVLVVGATGGFGKYLIPELIRRKASFNRIGAFVDITRPQDAAKTETLRRYGEQGVEIVEASPGDPGPFKGMAFG